MQNMFGTNNNPNKPFGSFGTSTTTSGVFGSATGSTGNTGFGFGATKPGGLFGASQSSTNTFGSAVSNGGLFGSSNQPVFGAPTTTPQQATGGLFGQTTGTSSFLKPATGATFGASSGFSGSTGNAGLFGAQTTQPAGGGLFGATQPSTTGTGLFGSTAFGAAGSTAVGSTAVKFTPTDGQDNMVRNGVSSTVKTKHYCLSGMKHYESKSLEEIRLEDYAANVKGPKPAGAVPSGGLFGATQPAAASTGFGGFGTPTATSTTGFGGFGTTSTQSTTGFGSLGKPSGSLFGTGTGTGTSTAGGLFGQTSAATAGFGAAATTGQTGGLFGNTAAKPNPFGATAGFGTTGTTFGQANPATTGFGFGAKPTTAFGATTSASTGFGFGTQNTTTGGFGTFGAKPATGFGTQPATGAAGGFGGFGSLGQTGATTGFGLNKPATGFGTAGSAFGTGTSGFSSLATVGTQQQQQQPVQLASNIDLQTQQALVQQQIFALANSPYGDSPLFRNIRKDSKNKKEVIPTDPTTQKMLLTSSGGKLKVNTRPTAKVKLTNLNSVQAIGTAPNNKADLFDGLDDDSCYTPEKYGTRRSVKKLVIRSSPAVGGASSHPTTADNHRSAFSSPSLYSGINRSAVDLANSHLHEEIFNLSGVDKPQRSSINKLYPTLELDDTIGELQSGGVGTSRPVKLSPRERKPLINETYAAGGRDSPAARAQSTAAALSTPGSTTNDVKQRLSINKQEHNDISEGQGQPDQIGPPVEHPCGVVCTRTDYYTLPALEQLEEYLDDNGDCFVENLSIGREGYGSVFFPGVTNVANLDMDNIVHFRRKEVTIYPNDDDKPPQGEGLNRLAEVTLDCVWPNDKSTRSPIKSPDRLKVMNYQEKIELATSRIGAKFIDYRPDTGSWVFEVKHFSKYGLLDSEDSEDDNAITDKRTAGEVKKLKALDKQSANVQRQSIHHMDSSQGQMLASGDALTSRTNLLSGSVTTPSISTNYLGPGLNDSADDMENQRPLRDSNILAHRSSQYSQDEEVQKVEPDLVPRSHLLAAQCGVETTDLQRMKASFLGLDNYDLHLPTTAGNLQHRMTEGCPSVPLLKYPSTSQGFSLSTQSPLCKPRTKGSTPTRDKFGSNLDKTKTKSECVKTEHDAKLIGSLLKPHRTSTEIAIPEPDYLQLPSGAERPLRPRSRIQGHRLQLAQIALNRSLLKDKSKHILDAACTEGRRSRVGWGPNMMLTHSGSRSLFSNDERKGKRLSTKLSILSPGRSRQMSPYQVTLETANLGIRSYQTDPLVLETRIKALKVQLKHSVFTHADDQSCHKLSPAPGITALHDYGRESLNDLDAAVAGQSGCNIQLMFRHHILIWELAVALWGSLPEFEHLDDLDTDSYLYQNARNEAFSRWLSYAANFKVEKETTKRYIQTNGVTAAIFSHLTARQIPEATKLAIKNNDLRLAMLLSQAGPSQATKNILNKQLCDWNSTTADTFISKDRFKLYVLLSGSLVWENTSGLTNCCLDLDWKRSLALHYWYSQSKMNINTAIAQYDSAWKDDSECEAYAAPPLPLYMEEEGQDDCESRDVCYHLLKLYCNNGHRLEHLLSAASNTPDPLDYHISWHLMQVLSSLNYKHLGDYQTAAIHTRYAEQLESCGLWEWAVLPLLNLACPHTREKAIKDLLLRHVRINVADSEGSDGDSMSVSEEADDSDSTYSNKERFIITQLNIPSRWLHEAKAIKARCEGLYEEEAWHLLLSRQLNPAHKIIMNHIAPHLIVKDDLDGLHSYLDLLQQASDSVSGWMIGGKVYLDYITIHDIVEELREATDKADGYSLEKLRPEVQSLGRRLLSLTTPTPIHLLAQSMMSVHTAHNIRYVMSLDEDMLVKSTDTVSSRHLVEPLNTLPMQSDDAVLFLRETMSSYMLEY